MGVINFANNEKYEGDMLNGKQHGKGIYYFSNEDKFSGDWINGQMHGKGVLTYANGNWSSGRWANDKRHGEFYYYDESDREGVFIWYNNDEVVEFCNMFRNMWCNII